MASARNNRKRRRGRGRLGPLFKLLCVLAVAVAATVGATVFFQVETVVVSGNSRYTQEEILQATGIQTGDNLFRINKYKIATQVRQGLPYIEDLSIRRSLPSTIVIHVTEWSAVARVEVPQPKVSAAPVEEDSSQKEQGDKSQTGVPEIAQEPWLISVGGKLLEVAGPDSPGISVTGITPIMPRAGMMLVLPQEEQDKVNALLAILDSLEQLEMLPQVSTIALDSTQVVMGYMGRFTVKLPINGDFSYKLRALQAAVVETQKKLGEQTSGTFDLTQEDFTAVYSPDSGR